MPVVPKKRIVKKAKAGKAPVYKIFYDAYPEAEWFRALSPSFRNAVFEPINRSTDPKLLALLRYDKPDIILFKNNAPVLSLEKTTEVPTGHNIGQRFGRIVCAAEEGVLGVYFGPFFARKHGKFTSLCWINVRQLQAMLLLHKFHGVPSLAINWKADTNGELIRTGSESKELKALVRDLVANNWKLNSPLVKEAEDTMRKEIATGLKRHTKYHVPPPSVTIIETSSYLTDPRFKKYPFSKTFLRRKESLHYKVGMKAGLRSDPFTGMQMLYDYLCCRNGPKKSMRSRNLVLEIPDLTLADWNAVTNKARKDKRLLQMFPDLLLLKDGPAY